jgi:hypothetical protein
MDDTIWIVVKQWPGGRIEPVAAYRDEQQARYAAGQLIGREENWIVLWTVPLKEHCNGTLQTPHQ